MSKPFTIAWKNPDPPIPSPGVNLVKCGVCQKKIHPFDTIGYYEIAVRPGYYSGYEYRFYVCSEECDKKREPFIKKMGKELK